MVERKGNVANKTKVKSLGRNQDIPRGYSYTNPSSRPAMLLLTRPRRRRRPRKRRMLPARGGCPSTCACTYEHSRDAASLHMYGCSTCMGRGRQPGSQSAARSPSCSVGRDDRGKKAKPGRRGPMPDGPLEGGLGLSGRRRARERRRRSTWDTCSRPEAAAGAAGAGTGAAGACSPGRPWSACPQTPS